MTPGQKAILRNSLIAQCAAAAGNGLPLATLAIGVKLAGFGNVTEDDLLGHLHFLTDDRKLSVAGSAMSAALRRWTITADGVRYAEENGLA